jgi:hypothetical protein
MSKLSSDAFTLFGKPFRVTERTDTRIVHFARCGIFTVMITELSNGKALWLTSYSGIRNESDSKEAARDDAELELRQIMRECFEIAGAMEVPIGDPLNEWQCTTVRFQER